MKNTPLIDRHLALKARMAAFAGYNMPISYTGIKKEHHAVRNNVGVFDVSHMGEFIVKGKEALDFLQYVTSNDISKLEIGDAQYSCFPNDKGGIVDDLIVYRLPEDKCSEGERAYMLVVNASNMEKDWNWLEKHNRFDTNLIDISDQTALIAVQGPKATEVLQSLTEVDLESMKFYTFQKGQLAGVNNVLISATGYTGAGGFELYVNSDDAAQVWDAIFEAGKTLGIQAAGLGARDTLRLEMGYCLYGNDIDDSTSPIEARLGWITKFNKGEFINRAMLLEHKEQGGNRRLIGFQLLDRGVPRKEYSILDEEGNEIGKVTSGTQSPSLGKAIGLGYVDKAFSKQGSSIFIEVRKKKIPAEVVKLPFYKKA